MHLVLLSHFKFVLVEHEKHLLVKVLLQIVFDEGFLHGGSALSSMHLLALQHLVELLLASSQKQFFEIHFRVIWIIKLFEKADA